MNVAKAKITDFLDIARLDSETIHHYDILAMADSAVTWKTWIEYALVYSVKNEKNNIIAAVVAFPMSSYGWCIHKVLIRPEYYDKDIAVNMLSALLDEIDQREARAFVTVQPEEKQVIKLFSSLGFQKKTNRAYFNRHDRRFSMTRLAKESKGQKGLFTGADPSYDSLLVSA